MNPTPIAAIVAALCLIPGCEDKPQPAPAPSQPAATAPAATAPPIAGTPAAAPPVTMPSLPTGGPTSGSTISALGLSFTVPEGWKAQPPANAMRLAEIEVPDPSGDPAKASSVVFSTAGGGVQANIDRWAGQMKDASGQPAAPTTEKKTISGIPVTTVSMAGAYAGMGETTPRPDWAMRAAIIETPAGLLFIKMTGPGPSMAAAADGFTALVESMKRP